MALLSLHDGLGRSCICRQTVQAGYGGVWGNQSVYVQNCSWEHTQYDFDLVLEKLDQKHFSAGTERL